MKKLIAFCLTALMLFVLSAPVISTAADRTCQVEKCMPEMVYINDSFTPSVSPLFSKSVPVYALNDAITSVIKEVEANSNSPPKNIDDI